MHRVVCGNYRSAPIQQVLLPDQHPLYNLAAGKIPVERSGAIALLYH